MPLHFSQTKARVLVTGATGFIGQRLVRALLADGHHVSVLSRHPAHALTLFHNRVQAVAAMSELAPDTRIDVIVNLAGARILGWRWTEKRKVTLLASRLRTTNQIVHWIASAGHKPALFFSGSAIGYYGVQPPGDNARLTESDAPQAIFMSQLCQQWEAAAQQAADYGVRVIRMRFGLVLGRQGALPMLLLPIKLGLGGPLGRGTQWLSWIHVDDILRAIAHLWRNHEQYDATPAAMRALTVPGQSDVYNFTAPDAVTQKDFSAIAAQLCRRPSFMPTPALAMRVLLGEQADLLLEGQRVTPAHLQADGFMFAYPDLRGALASLMTAERRPD